MGDERDQWRDYLRRIEHQLSSQKRAAQVARQALRKVKESECDPNAATNFLDSLRDLVTASSFSLEEQWQEYWEEERRRARSEFKFRLEERLRDVQEKIRSKTGENWELSVEGIYPRYTVGGLVTVDIGQWHGDVTRAAKKIEQKIYAIIRPRFVSPVEFLRCLLGAYMVARALDKLQRDTEPAADQKLRRLHQLVPAVARDLKIGSIGRDGYPVNAFGVDLGRCVAAKVLEVNGQSLNLVPTKSADEGVRVRYPGLPISIYGKARFEKGG